jgi:hypothetical protein
MEELARFHIFEDCVYAYEYALAQRELSVLTGRAELPSALAEGEVALPVAAREIQPMARRLAYYDRIKCNGHSTDTFQKTLSGVGGAIASSSGKAYMTHWIYPYKGKFHPQMIRGLLNVMEVREGETVLDPMTGSGTVNVEASLMGIHSIGVDCSPIGVLASRVKCALLHEPDARAFVKAVPEDTPSNGGKQSALEHFDETARKPARSVVSPVDGVTLLEFEAISISQLPGKEFPAIWQKMARYYRETALQASRTVSELGIKLGTTDVRLGDARKLELADDSVDGIVTSPPYAIALDYVARNTIQLERLGYKVDDLYERTIGLRGKAKERADTYYLDLAASIREMYRVLRPGRYAVVVIGDTRFDNKLLPTIQRAIGFGKEAGFRLVDNMRKVSAGRFGLFRTESMLLFQKPA